MNSENFKIIGVTRNLVSIEILDPTNFDGNFTIGSFIKIPYIENEDDYVVGVVENYKIRAVDEAEPQTSHTSPNFTIEVRLVGTFVKNDSGDYVFNRGAHGIPLPPNNGVSLFSHCDFGRLYSSNIKKNEKFVFSKLAYDLAIDVPVNGDRFFNKHFAIVGSTGSGKSHTVVSLLQQAVREKESDYNGLNNSHIVIFDIHDEYKRAFPDANYIDQDNINIPYWLFDSEELADLFIESNEDNSHNQVSIFKQVVTLNKIKQNPDIDENNIYFDSPVKFDIQQVVQYIKNLNNEVIGRRECENLPKDKEGKLIPDRAARYFTEAVEFCETSTAAAKKASTGPYKGSFERFIFRLENTINNPRLKFIFSDQNTAELSMVLEQLLSYGTNKSNIAIINLSGIPFEVMSITVSLISRILFDFAYYSKKKLPVDVDCETPLLLVFEEAHKYAPKSDLVRYRASRQAIERIAKEGRKYGITLGIVSQRPSEISETIFSQCNNFVAMRLTNSDDQYYVKRLLPDSLGELTNSLTSLQSGEALLVGEACVLPSLVKINMPEPEPESTDIKYLALWKDPWKDVDFGGLSKKIKGLED